MCMDETPKVLTENDSAQPPQPDQQLAQPTVVINGQPLQKATDVFTARATQPAATKSSKARSLFIALGILQLAGIALFIAIIVWAILQARAGVSGTEFIGLIVFVTLVPVVGLIALFNLIGLPLYMWKYKPQGQDLVLGIISLAISVCIALYGAHSLYQLFVEAPRSAQKSQKESAEKYRKYAAQAEKPEITKEAAVELLKSCKLKGFYYTNQSDKSNGGWGELSTTGVVVTYVDGEPYRISIADRLLPELLPIAREEQKRCGSPQFWHDGAYEQFKDGRWYFKDTVVEDTTIVKTKAEALSLLQSCKVDYFVGQEGGSLAAKDTSTQAWLKEAQSASTGIAILKDSPMTYVFASRALTAELQDTARQYRQSCSDTRKLYISIDEWNEVEYPAGTWHREKQQ